MKISEMIKNLYAFMDEHGDVDCWYAADDEGNNFTPIYFKPSLLYKNEYDATFDIEDVMYEEPEYIEELTKICVVN